MLSCLPHPATESESSYIDRCILYVNLSLSNLIAKSFMDLVKVCFVAKFFWANCIKVKYAKLQITEVYVSVHFNIHVTTNTQILKITILHSSYYHFANIATVSTSITIY